MKEMDLKLEHIIVEDIDDEIADLTANLIWEKLFNTVPSDERTRKIQKALEEISLYKNQNHRDIIYKYGYAMGKVSAK